MSRLGDIERFYDLMDRLERSVGGRRTLADLRSFKDVPRRGVYFFFAPGELRRESGRGMRVVRVGTHALSENSRSTLSQRLSQHRGGGDGKGNHRGSIFRLLIGQALIARGDVAPSRSWRVKGDLTSAAESLQFEHATLAAAEEPIERAVSCHLGAMTFLCVRIDDEPGSSSLRDMIERNCIALLSNFERECIDPASANWLGNSCDRPLVRWSGLWNQRHTDEAHDPLSLDKLEGVVAQMEEAHDRVP
jgi:hypothetical protein